MSDLPADDEPTPAELRERVERRAARNSVKLRALVRQRWGIEATPSGVGSGAAISDGDTAWVLVDGDHGLGAALVWSRRAGASELHVVADPPGPGAGVTRAGTDDSAGNVARRAGEFTTPIHVWRSEGVTLVEVDPAPFPERPGPPDSPELVAMLRDADLDVVVEGDRLAGEYRGLEVARIVRALDDGEPILEVGVGQFDRALTAMMYGDMDGRESIARAVGQLRSIRRPGGPQHPLANLVPERWLRSTLVAEPDRVGCDHLVPVPTPEPRDRLRLRGVAAASGERDGEPVVVVCTVGIDLEATVLAADARLAIDPDATLLLALPARDALPVITDLVADLRRPAEIVPVTGEWRR